MSSDELIKKIDRFLATAVARRICHRYGADPQDAQSELYSKLINRRPSRGVRSFDGWFHVTCTGLLKNYLRRQHLTWV